MSYSKAVMDHYENPRNVGVLDKTDTSVGTGLVGGSGMWRCPQITD